ncbi:MAG: sugar transferase [Planctomycetales bacterium]
MNAETKQAPSPARSAYACWGKRVFDLAVTIPGLILFSPIFVLLMVLIRWKLGSPIFFRQMRPGRDGKPFQMIKFRSMTDARDERGELLPDHVRLTRFGKFLRGSSLDEVPELFNVLAGEMSLVGPRPLLMKYLPLYTAEQARRHDVPPGITGWAQVNGRNAISWERKFELDTWYVDHCSLGLDLKILLMTVKRCSSRRGSAPKDHVTMPEFTGSKRDGKSHD